MTENAQLYREQGYLALPGFVPTEVTHALLSMLKSDLVQGGVSFDQLKRKHDLLASAAVEVYGTHYLPLSTFLWGMTRISRESSSPSPSRTRSASSRAPARAGRRRSRSS